MAPAPISPSITDYVIQTKQDNHGLEIPPATIERLTKAGIDLSHGYPYNPAKPLYLDDVYKIRSEPWEHVDAGSRADPEKKALLGAAKEVIHLTRHIGTEIVGLQLKDLTNQQRDELALLIAERSVVFFRDQDLSPQQQKALGEYYGEVEVHVSDSTSCPDFRVKSIDNITATSRTCAGCSWGVSPLAGSSSRRPQTKLPQNRRCVDMAQRSRPRKPACWYHAPP